MNRRATARGRGPARRSMQMGLWTFFIALAVTLLSTTVSAFLPLPVAAALIFIIIAVGIVFDMVGIAAAAARQAPFHAMAAKRTYAASQAIVIVRNADRVSNICNDLVGDICGTVSGAATAAIVFRIALGGISLDEGLLSMLMVSAVAALTVGGKAAGKGYALDRANEIVYRVAALLAGWERGLLALRRLVGASGGRTKPATRGRQSEGQEVDRRGRRPRRDS